MQMKKSAILITYNEEDAITEAVGLCDSAGYTILHIIKQSFLKKPKYGISEGVLENLVELTERLQPNIIIFDEILKPSQNYNLASKLKREIFDREMLILEIFESRSSSAESKLQVKLAQLRYEMTRAKERVRLSSMGEQPGFMGIGKFEVDVYYNDIKHRMQTIRSKLEKAGKQRELHRQGRKRLGFKTISLAGYTSAGKTTLFNALTGETREESQELFTTLSTTTRRITIDQESFLISDTVGFISKLPAYMIDAFKSTLEELNYTDVVLVVIDISDSIFDLKKKFTSCIRTLSEIGVEMDRIVFVCNKSDLTSKERVYEKMEILGLVDNKKKIDISSKTGYNIDKLAILIKNITGSQKILKNKNDIGITYGH